MPGPGTSAIESERMYIPPLSQVCPRGHTTALGATPIGGPPDRVQRSSSTGGTGEDVSCSAGAITADVSGSSYAHPAIPPRRHRNRRWMRHYPAALFVTDTWAQKPVTFLVDATDGRGVHKNRIHTPSTATPANADGPLPTADEIIAPVALLRSQLTHINWTGPSPRELRTTADAARRREGGSGAATPLQRPRSRGEPRSHRFGSGPRTPSSWTQPQSASAPNPGGSNTGSGAHLSTRHRSGPLRGHIHRCRVRVIFRVHRFAHEGACGDQHEREDPGDNKDHSHPLGDGVR